MYTKTIHIVSFDNPYPPNYGGANDVFYKIKALSYIGIQIHLHLFYTHRTDISVLKEYCKSITLYKRNTSLLKHFSLKPFSVASRRSHLLNRNLKQAQGVIFFESLRCCASIEDVKFSNTIAVRSHNIEHYYSLGLSNNENNLLKKIAHFIEALKQKYYQKVLFKAHYIFPISYFETTYFKKKFGNKVRYLPVFHGFSQCTSIEGFGNYALYHGDLSTADNYKSLLFLINVFKPLDYKLIIASSLIPKSIKRVVKKIKNISYKQVKTKEALEDLVANAHINVMYSHQTSGTKLKVFFALFKGRHCLINSNIIDDAAILSVCELANNSSEFKEEINRLFKTPFKVSLNRISALKKYNDIENAKLLASQLF